jgi:hypothetical protein
MATAKCFYTLGFKANELAEIVLSGNGASDLDLYVFDANGNLVEFDEGYSGNCFISWVPRWTGASQVVVVNRGCAKCIQTNLYKKAR